MTTATELAPEEAAPAAAEGDAPPSEATPRRHPQGLIVGIRLYETSTERIRDLGDFDVTTDIERLNEAHLVAISTRVGRGQTVALPGGLDPETSPPIVAICHPGGAEAAVKLMQLGCAGVVAEGNERALAAFVDPEQFTDAMVEGFLERLGKSRTGGRGKHRDPVTNLPEVASFEVRLGEFIEAGTAPNVVMMQITNISDAQGRTDRHAIDLLRRRLANSYSDAARRNGCEVFILGQATFAVLDGAQHLVDIEPFARDLITITEAFKPAGVKLRLAVGAVTAKAGSEVMAIREQADQAMTAAAQADESAFVTAEQVTVLLASSTEYQVAEQLARRVDAQLPYPDGHSARVADLAAGIGREIGYQGRELSSLRLAALLHDVGKIASEGTADSGGAGSDFAERGARYVLAGAGPEVADAIRYQTERWDGQGPNGLAEGDIPLGARIICIADTTDGWLHPPEGTDALTPDALVEQIGNGSGSVFDPALADTALRLLGGS